MYIKKSFYKKLGVLLVLSLMLTLLTPLVALASGVQLSLDGQDNNARVTYAVGDDVTIATDTLCNIWLKEAGVYTLTGQAGPGQDLVVEDVQQGAYVVDAYAVDSAAYARATFFVDSAVTATAAYSDGKITVNGNATNIANPYYQFWKTPKGQNAWVAFGNPDAQGFEGYYGTNAVQSFDAATGETYEIAVYAKDENGRSQWQDAVATSFELTAEQELIVIDVR